MLTLPNYFEHNRRLEHLVENKTSYTVKNAQLNIYETHHFAEKVYLKFSDPIICSMLEGKKIMHLQNQKAFDFLPGESIILPSDKTMCIDFPLATESDPTKCLAMQIDAFLIQSVVSEMNEKMPRLSNQDWKSAMNDFSFTNSQVINQLVQRLIFVFIEDNPSKEIFIEMMIKELIIRIKQTQNKNAGLEISNFENTRLGVVLKYIKAHLQEDICMEQLAEKANMSLPHFHRVFKNEMGTSPVHFINENRLQLASRLLHKEVPIKEVYQACGFNNLSYFNRQFKRYFGVSPGAYRNSKKSK